MIMFAGILMNQLTSGSSSEFWSISIASRREVTESLPYLHFSPRNGSPESIIEITYF